MKKLAHALVDTMINLRVSKEVKFIATWYE